MWLPGVLQKQSEAVVFVVGDFKIWSDFVVVYSLVWTGGSNNAFF